MEKEVPQSKFAALPRVLVSDAVTVLGGVSRPPSSPPSSIPPLLHSVGSFERGSCMSQETWVIDDIDRQDGPASGFLEIGDRIVLTIDAEDNVTVEIPSKLPPLWGKRRIQGWFHWFEGYFYNPEQKLIYIVHAFPRVTGQEQWLEGFFERILITDGTVGDVRDTETWTAMKQPPEPGEE